MLTACILTDDSYRFPYDEGGGFGHWSSWNTSIEALDVTKKTISIDVDAAISPANRRIRVSETLF